MPEHRAPRSVGLADRLAGSLPESTPRGPGLFVEWTFAFGARRITSCRSCFLEAALEHQSVFEHRFRQLGLLLIQLDFQQATRGLHQTVEGLPDLPAEPVYRRAADPGRIKRGIV